MRVLLDECVPRKLKRELANHEVQTVTEHGWSGIKNGDLLKLAEAEFDIFLTVDQNLSFPAESQKLRYWNHPHGGSKQSAENTFATNARGARSDQRAGGGRDTTHRRSLTSGYSGLARQRPLFVAVWGEQLKRSVGHWKFPNRFVENEAIT
jgi:Domain of unknown function (DUF5615)